MLLWGGDIHGKTLGIIGFGRIGRAMARRARGFDMRVLYHDRVRDAQAEAELGATFVDFEALLRQSDFLTIHASLNPDTRRIFNADALSKMKPSAVLVNAARGPLVEPQALHDALKTGRLFAAALDVTDPEPMAPDDPLLSLPNCLVVPHIGSASIGTRAKMAAMAAENLLAGLRGERLPNCVNPAVYDATAKISNHG